MLPDPGLLAALAMGLGLGAAIILLILAARKPVVDETNPMDDGTAGFSDPDEGRRFTEFFAWPSGKRSWGRRSARLTGALVVAALVMGLTRWPVAAAALAALILFWPYLFGGARSEQAAIARLEALVVWTESLRDTVAANAGLEQAIAASIQQAPTSIKPSLDRLAGRIRVQTPLDVALLDLAADLDDASADLVIAALLLNVRRRGDRLAQVLTNLAASARDELDLRRRVSAGRAGLRRSVQIVVVITLGIATYLVIFGGAYLAPYRNPAGQVALSGVVALFAGGFVWMRRLTLSDEGRPLLSQPQPAAGGPDVRLLAVDSRPAPVNNSTSTPPSEPYPGTAGHAARHWKGSRRPRGGTPS